jgi:hypothetical protein
MKTINLSDKDFEKLVQLSKDYQKIYGNENTTWNFQDVEDMRKIGEVFMEIVLEAV